MIYDRIKGQKESVVNLCWIVLFCDAILLWCIILLAIYTQYWTAIGVTAILIGINYVVWLAWVNLIESQEDLNEVWEDFEDSLGELKGVMEHARKREGNTND